MRGRSKPFYRRPLGDRSLSKLEPCQLPWLVIVAHDGFVSIQQLTKAVAGSRRKGVHGAFTLTLAPSHRSAPDVHHTALRPASCAARSNRELSLLIEAHDDLSGAIAERAGFRGLAVRPVDLMLMIPTRHPGRRLSMPFERIVNLSGLERLVYGEG